MTKEQDKSVRRLDSWIESYLEYTSGVPSPLILRKWAAWFTVSAALERRCWAVISNNQTYPNMYILLVTPPAVGKGQALNPADDLLKACGMFNVAPTALTKAAFVDQLKGAPNPRLIPGTSIMHNSLILIAPEFGTFLTAHDHEFLNTLNDIYDCRNIYEERTRGGGLISIERPHFAMIG